MAILDNMKGFRPYNSPKSEMVFEYQVTDAQTVDCHEPVAFASGLVSPAATTTDNDLLAGVALGYGLGTDDDVVSVCVDPDQVYSVVVDALTYAQITALIGGFANIVVGTGANGYSTDELDGSTLTATFAADLKFQVIALDPVEGNSSAAAGSVRALVKLTSGVFNTNTYLV